MAKEIKERPARADVAAVDLPEVSEFELQASVSELRKLACKIGTISTRQPTSASATWQ